MIGLGSRRRPGLGGGLGGGLHTRGLSVFSSGSRVVTARETADSVISALTPAAWYRNATGVTSAGGFASQWDDYSGNARHLVQATGTNQPAYAAGVFTFDGADNYMEAASWSQTQPITIYLVGKQITWTGNDQLFDGNVNNSGTLYQVSATPTLALYAGGFTNNNTNLAVNTLGIICAVINNASSSLRINNTAKTTGTAGTNNMGGFVLGASGLPGNYGHMTALESIIFSAAHDDTQQSSVITALNNALTVF